MRMNRIKAAALSFLTIAALCTTSATAYAATNKSEKTKIKAVHVELSIPEMVTGDDVPDNAEDIINVVTEGVEIDEAEYTNMDSEWEYGDTPEIKITLEIPDSDAYIFASGLKVKVDKKDGKYSSISISKTGSYKAKITLKLKKVGGELDCPEELEWQDNYTATWEPVDWASSYSVKLYRNGSSAATVSTVNYNFNFWEVMNRTGDYTFKVKAIAGSRSDNSDWSDESEEKYIDEYNKSNGSGTISVTNVTTPDGSNNTGNNNNSSSSGNGPSTNGGSSSGASGSYGWKSDSNGWYYIYNGSVLKGSWLKDTDGKWYYMDNTGYMHTGWLHDSDNRWYYMNPNAGGPKGSMVTGLFTINGNLYYFSPVSGGPLGSMVTGNQTVNGVKYYFDPVTGVGTRQ